MEVVLAEPKLDELFEQTAQTGYTKELLFSSLVKMMSLVVCSVRFLYWVGLQSDVSRNWRVENRRLRQAQSLRTECQSSTGSIQCQRNDDDYRASGRADARAIAGISNHDERVPLRLTPTRGRSSKFVPGNGLGATEHRLSVLLDTRAGALPWKIAGGA